MVSDAAAQLDMWKLVGERAWRHVPLISSLRRQRQALRGRVQPGLYNKCQSIGPSKAAQLDPVSKPQKPVLAVLVKDAVSEVVPGVDSAGDRVSIWIV